MGVPNQIASTACAQSSRLADLLAGQLNGQAEEAIATHLSECPACQREYEQQAADLLGGRPAAASLDRPLPAVLLRGETHIGSHDTHREREAALADQAPLPERIGPYRIL